MESINENSNENNSENNSENNFAQSVEADPVTDGLMSVPKFAEEPTPSYIENPPQEAELSPMAEEKPKDKPLIDENPTIEQTPTEAEPKDESDDWSESESEKDLTAVQEKDIQIVEAVAERFKNAFEKTKTEEGEKCLKLKDYVRSDKEGDFAYTRPFGNARLAINEDDFNVYVTRIGIVLMPMLKSSLVVDNGGINASLSLSTGKATFKDALNGQTEKPLFQTLLFRDKKTNLRNFKDIFAACENAHKDDVKEGKPTEDIIKELT